MERMKLMAVLAGVVLIAVILQSAVFGFESPTGAAADGTYEYLPNGTEAGNWTENCTLPYNETSPCNQTLPGNDTGNFTEPDNETLPGNETGNSTEPGNETLPGNDTLPRNETGNSTEQVNNTAFDNLTEVQGPKTENITASLDSVLMAEDGQDFSILSGPVTVSGTVNYLDDNVTLDETSYTSGIYTISGTVERPDNSTYGSQTNPDITDPVISWDWAVNTTSSDDPINVTISGDENLSSCRLVINGINETMRQYNLTYFYYDWAPSVGNSTLQACCNDTANNTGCTNEAWYELFYPPEETPHHHACSKAWQCTAWSSCVNGKQARTCDCGCDHDADCTGSSDEEQSCTVQAPNCTASWSCTNWGNCVNSLQSRVCTCSCPNDNDCYGDHQTSQACECDSAADCDDGNICTADSCATGTCQHLPANTTCSDNNPCTLNDYCANGACVPGNNTCECLTDADCNDGNICTADSCLNNACQFAYTSDPCDDANDCTANDYCMDGVCTPGPFTCPCQTDADCNDNNPCTDESCVSTVCTYSDANASCDDGSDCTLNDYCSNGLCAPGKDTCKKACNDAWSCTDWGACVGGTQSRTCNCACDRCTGDSDTTRSCAAELPHLDVLVTRELLVGDPLQINVRDQSGNPLATQIELVRPDGSTINLGVDSDTAYTVDRPGLWTTRVSKAGYVGDEAESTVVKITPALGVDQMENTVENSIALLKDDRVRASLLTVTVIIILSLLLRGRRRKEKIKKL